MNVSRIKNHRTVALLLAVATVFFSGCITMPRWKWQAMVDESGQLAQLCESQQVQLNTLEMKRREAADRLLALQAETDRLRATVESDRQLLAEQRGEIDRLGHDYTGLARGGVGATADVEARLRQLAQSWQHLRIDPATGIAKLDTDIVFADGDATLMPAAAEFLKEVATFLKRPEANDLRIVVAGHTDDRRIAGRATRDRFPDNFRLSAERANVVAAALRDQGITAPRIGVAGFGPHQPVAPNITSTSRGKNRRVEIFVINRDVPVVGWTESIPSVY